jgi:hypothetical protein
MQVKDSVRMVLGSVAIYVVVAACSSNGGTVVYNNGDGGHGGTDAKTFGDTLINPMSEASADENQSGTRLKTQRYVGTDGSSQFIGFYDSQLAVACAFAVAADGKTRCVPSGSAVAVVTTGYADSGCTQPIAAMGSTCAAPKYAVEGVGTAGCPNTPEVQTYSAGALFSGTVYDSVAGKCTMLSGSDTAGYAFYSLGAMVPASTFVEASVQSP